MTEKEKPQRCKLGELKHIIATGDLAIYAGERLKAGSRVVVDGKVEERPYTDKDGQKRGAWEVWATAICLQEPDGEGAVEDAKEERETG